MYTENDLSSNGYVHGTESSQSKLNRQISMKNLDNPDVKMSFNGKGSDHMRESEMGHDGFRLKSSKFGNLGSHQELTLSYLCDNNNNNNNNNNSKMMMMGFQDKEISGKNFLSSLEKGGSSSSSRYKGKEVVSDSINEEDERLVERDFLQLNGISGGGGGGGGSKRENDEGEEEDREKRDKKPKLENQTLDLSLSLPDVSLSLTSSNPLPRADHPLPSLKPSRSTQSFMPSNNNTRTGSSDDYTAASLSYSYSHQFSHNPSCSLTHNSTENFEYSVGSRRREDQIWYGGEGTNGSVHSRFKPVGDGVSLSNNGGFGYSLMQANQPNEKECSNSMYRTGSENQSFFPSELPARPWRDTQSGDSRGRASEQQRGFENSEGGRPRKLTRPERILREIVSESITVMAQILHELPDETIETTKDHLKNLIELPEKREELAALQNRLERRSDLTFELLSKSHRAQLDILVAVKTGLSNYLAEKNRLPTPELIEIFLLTRCRNVNCKSILPIDDCDCKICSTKKGFCSNCMCPVCSNFDCANNTCSWVGCDVCSHWCHVVCGIQKNLIKPGATTEMQFHCIGCGHASEMYGFVKEVFMCCAKDWGLETLIKELDCVRKIFRGSADSKGKDLWNKSEEMLSKLENKLISPSDACSLILQFFKYGKSEFSVSGSSSKDLTSAVTTATAASVQISQQRGADVVSLPPSISLPPKSIPYNINSSSNVRRDSLKDNARQIVLKSPMNDTITPEEDMHSNILSKGGFESLESIVRIKEAEARMFQTRADDARREAEGYRRMARARSEKLEDEYTTKLAKLCLQDTEDRRRKKLEEVKALENSHCDYYNMKIRMQAEITGLLERMEATKQQWV